LELRKGNQIDPEAKQPSDGSMQREMTAEMIFDYMGILLDKEAFAEKDFTMNVKLPDVQEKHMLQFRSGVLLHYADTLADNADVTVTCPKNALLYIFRNNMEGFSQAAMVEGDGSLLADLMGSMQKFPANFNIVEP